MGQVGSDAKEWDERYGESDRIWSGEPNGALVDQVRGLTRGTVLDAGCSFVHHDRQDPSEAYRHRFDPEDWVSLRTVAALLDDDWEIEVDELRERTVGGGSGAHHTHDVVLQAHLLNAPAQGVTA